MLVAAYSNSFGNDFHFDDFHTVTDNPSIRNLGNVGRFFTDATTFSVLPANRTYRPLVSASLALDYALGHGYVPFWFHLSTFLWLVVLLGVLYLLYESILQRTEPSSPNRYLALGAAAWFGLHPVVAETMNYVIQRGDLYCTLGCVAALAIYARYPLWRKWGLYLLPLAAALLCKPPAAIFPVLLLFYVFFFEAPEGKGRWKKSLVAILPSLVITALLLWLQSAMTPKSFAPSMFSPWDYRLTQPFVWGRYFAQLFLPLHLNVDSDLGPLSLTKVQTSIGLIFVVMLVTAIGLTSRRKRLYPIAYGLIWFVVTQLPTSLYPLSEVENDHRMFFSFAGLILAVVWAAWLGLRRMLGKEMLLRARPVIVTGAVLLLVGYAWGVHVRNQAWRTEESLWLDDVQKSPRNGRGLMIYGLTQMNKGEYPVALDYFTRALEFTPNYPTLEINLGVVNGAMARKAEAERHFQRAIHLPLADDQARAFYGRWLLSEGRVNEAIAEERVAVLMNPQRPLQHDVLLTALARAGDADALHAAAVEALAAVPDDAVAKSILRGGVQSTGTADVINLSLAEYQRGEYVEAIASAQKALLLDPKSAVAYNNIGAAYGAMGKWDEAIASETKALQLDPTLQIARNNLAAFAEKKRMGLRETAPGIVDLINLSMALNGAGKFEESIAAAQSALKLDPTSAEAWNNIAANYEAMKRWDDAIAAAHKAIALKPDFQLAKNNLAWSESQKKAGK
jgi:tetratricopeptide (TPR) repeat protein